MRSSFEGKTSQDAERVDDTGAGEGQSPAEMGPHHPGGRRPGSHCQDCKCEGRTDQARGGFLSQPEMKV